MAIYTNVQEGMHWTTGTRPVVKDKAKSKFFLVSCGNKINEKRVV